MRTSLPLGKPASSFWISTTTLALTLGLTLPAQAAIYEINAGDNLWARLTTLAPGDEVIVHAGTYPQTSRFEATWAGTAAMPIIVRAAEGEARPVMTRDSRQNLLNIHGSYFTLRGFEIIGGSHGIRASNVDHAVFEDLLVHDTADVGISCNIGGATCSYLTIRDCEIHHTNGTGEGMYLGCNGAGCELSNSIIERNYVHDLGGDQGDGIEIKQGSHSNIVRDNVIVRANYPGITLYSYDEAPGRVPNIIERNLVWTTRDNGIQVTGRTIVRNNIVIGAGASGIASQPNMATPTDVQILHNTIIGAGDACIRTNSWNTGTGFVIANNALYCEGARALRITTTTSAIIVGNVGLGSVEGAPTGFRMGTTLAADLGTMAMMARVYPPSGSRLIDAADGTQTVSDDFDLRARSGMHDVGAYERDASGMPAWLAVEGFKGFGGVMPGSDAGPSTTDAGPVVVVDAGSIALLDVGPLPDSGTVVRDDAGAGPDSTSGSCGCRAGQNGSRSGAVAMLALGLVIAARRKRTH